jgi:chemotaxis protein MotD
MGCDATCHAAEDAAAVIVADSLAALIADTTVEPPADDADGEHAAPTETTAVPGAVPTPAQQFAPQALAAALPVALPDVIVTADAPPDTDAVDADVNGAKPDPAALAALAAALKSDKGPRTEAPGVGKPAPGNDVPPAVPAPAGDADADAVFGETSADAAAADGEHADNEAPIRLAAHLKSPPQAQPQARPEPLNAVRGQDDGADTPDAVPAEQAIAARAARVAAPAESQNDGPQGKPLAFAPPTADPATAAKSAADPLSMFGLLASQAAARAAPTPAAAPATAPADPTIANLAIDIAARAHAGATRFEIRLDPPELGRVDVRLDVDREGHVSSKLYVERSETLDLLRREAPQLERALLQAGLKMSDTALEFALRDHAFRGDDSEDGAAAGTPATDAAADTAFPVTETVLQRYARYFGLGGGVDIRV